jgi:hypothetical protein
MLALQAAPELRETRVMRTTPDCSARCAARPDRRWAGRIHRLMLVLLLLPTWVCPSPTRGADGSEQTDSLEITRSVSLPAPGSQEVVPATEHPFRPGESLRFSVQYGFINAGSAWLEVQTAKAPDGRPAYNLIARAESNAFFSRFYKVRNRIESLWDCKGRFTWRYAEDRREGKYRAKSEIRFDPERHEAIYPDGEAVPTPPDVQDALSSFYYTRYQALPLGGSVVFDYHAGRKSQPLEVKVLGRERIDTPAGKFDCVAIEPVLHAGGIFKSKGRLVIWLTDDNRRMPVLMRSKVMIGSISVVLQEVKTGA